MIKPFIAITILAAPLLSAGAETNFRKDINPALLYFQAFKSAPSWPSEEQHELFGSSGGAWPDQPFSERAIEKLNGFSASFKLLHSARFSVVPCEWGYDLTEGPQVHLPGLAPAKQFTQVSQVIPKP